MFNLSEKAQMIAQLLIANTDYQSAEVNNHLIAISEVWRRDGKERGILKHYLDLLISISEREEFVPSEIFQEGTTDTQGKMATPRDFIFYLFRGQKAVNFCSLEFTKDKENAMVRMAILLFSQPNIIEERENYKNGAVPKYFVDWANTLKFIEINELIPSSIKVAIDELLNSLMFEVGPECMTSFPEQDEPLMFSRKRVCDLFPENVTCKLYSSTHATNTAGIWHGRPAVLPVVQGILVQSPDEQPQPGMLPQV